MAIGIALLGAGIFAQEEHLPAIQACPSLSLKAIYSRSSASATNLAAIANVSAYYDSSADNLEVLLQRDDIQAVVIALPALLLTETVKKALNAGKHVLSEKPIGKDVQTAQELLDWYKKRQGKEIWSVGENFRFKEDVVYGFEQAHRLGGKVTDFSVKLRVLLPEDNKYVQTAWRKDPRFKGGYLLDGGIHFVAALRHLLSAHGERIQSLAAFTSLTQPWLAPVDAVHATMRLTSGSSGTFSLSFGARSDMVAEMEVATENGTVTIKFLAATVTTKAHGETAIEKKLQYGAGVKEEMVAFAESIETGKPNAKATPEEALADLKIVHALLESGEQQGILQQAL